MLGGHGAQVKSKIQILGLFTFSNCDPEQEFECKNVELNEKRMIEFHNRTPYPGTPNILCTKDVANSTEILVDTLLPIALEDPNRHIECRGDGVYDNKIKINRLVVMTYISFHLTKLASSILHVPEWKSVLLICITDRPMYPAYFFEHPFAWN